ncbi:unnamed protein product [Ilex paraguariensis]|uniref:FAF domain-containing protein n=1 Tax=Ilex paraguariensis TaxID=185542 RepID=A0ABC8QWR7_9AQUA
MSTIVCQGVQSCLDTQLVETRILRLTFSAPKSIEFGMETREKCHYEDTHKKATTHLDNGGWSFLQSLSNISQTHKEETSEKSPYVHPLAKLSSSSSRLTQKSLELCTENLGCETGTDISESTIFSSSSYTNSESSPPREIKNWVKKMEPRKVNSGNFPPPLTTIRGSNSLQVRPHREGGRLIIKAVESPSTHSYFQAERSNGRFRLSFLKDCGSNSDLEETDGENEEGNEDDDLEEIENEADEREEDREQFSIRDTIHCRVRELSNVSRFTPEENVFVTPLHEENVSTTRTHHRIIENQDDEEKYGQEDEEERSVYMGKDMHDNSFDVGVEMGMEKFQSPSRCKESGHGNKRLCNWEPLWVATS